jgi:hypothetical protein
LCCVSVLKFFCRPRLRCPWRRVAVSCLSLPALCAASRPLSRGSSVRRLPVPPVSRCWPRVAALRPLSLRLFAAVRVLPALCPVSVRGLCPRVLPLPSSNKKLRSMSVLSFGILLLAAGRCLRVLSAP